MQIDDFEAAGCAAVFTDVASGARSDRQGLDDALAAVAEGDTLMVWRLDRMGRSLPHLVDVVGELAARGVQFRSLKDGAIDTTTASGELVFHIFAALAQFERNLIRQRTRAGLAAARARGRKGGRKPMRADHPKVVAAKRMHQDKALPIAQICASLNISRSTFYRYLQL